MSQRDPNDPSDNPNQPGPSAATPKGRPSVLDLAGRTSVYDPTQAPGHGPALPFAPGATSAPTQSRSPTHVTLPIAGVTASVPPRETVELLFYGPGAPARIRKQPAWGELVDSAEVPANAEHLDDELPPGRRAPPRDRFEVLSVLTRAPAIGPDSVAAMGAFGAGEYGAFVPPLVAAAGELEFLFDEAETLSATIAAVTPFLSTDKRLKEVVDAALETMAAPWTQGASQVVEALTNQIREAFVQARRAAQADYLETHVGRILLSRRHFQRRTIWGQGRIRCLFSAPGAREEVAAYLPEAIGPELPGAKRMKVRMVAEVRGPVDPADGAWVLRVLAAGRVLGR